MNYLQEDISNFEQISTKLEKFGINIEVQENDLIFTAFLTTLEIYKIVNEIFKNELELTFTAQSQVNLAPAILPRGVKNNTNDDTKKGYNLSKSPDVNSDIDKFIDLHFQSMNIENCSKQDY